jgi:hypothetical protein
LSQAPVTPDRYCGRPQKGLGSNGTATFANPDDYQAGIGDASVNLIVTGGGDFDAPDLVELAPSLRASCLLRRLNMARSALRRADPASASVVEIARIINSLSLGALP